MEFDLGEIFLKFILAVSLGALMGLERDGSWKKRKDLESVRKQAKSARDKFSFIDSDVPAKSIGGVRTYILISVLGAMTGIAYLAGATALVWAVTLGLFFFLIVSFVLNYFDKNTLGLTTEISIILIYLSSFMLLATDIPSRVIVAIAVLVIFIMSIKDQVSKLVSKFSHDEILDTTKFVLFALVILPFLPNETFGLDSLPFIGEAISKVFSEGFIEATTVFNPFQIWLVVVFIMSINFIGYFATRVLGESRGLGLVGLLGGLVSSTAVTEAMALQSRKPGSPDSNLALVKAAILANSTSFLRTIVVAAFVSFTLAAYLVVPMVAMTLFFAGWIGFTSFRSRGDVNSVKKTSLENQSYEDLGLKFTSPFSMKTALAFGGLFTAVLFFSSVALFFLGNSGFLIYSMLIAMTGMDTVTITTASWYSTGEITIQLAALVIVAAMSVNLIVKLIFSFVSGAREFSVAIGKLFVVDILIGIISLGVVFYVVGIIL